MATEVYLRHGVLHPEFIVVRPGPGSRLPEMKALGASWKDGEWTLPAALWNARQVEEALVGAIDPDLARHFSPAWSSIAYPELYEYQQDSAGWLASRPRGGLLCMSPGLGKTATAIAAAEQVVPADQVVVVAPASLLDTWRREIERWTDHGDVAVLRGTPDWEEARTARWLLVSWDTLARHADWFEGSDWPLWVLDESVLVKSRRARRFAVLRKLRSRIKRVWLLSGSPTSRFADDLWTQLSLIWPKAFRSYWRFAERYCVVEDGVWARKVVGDREARDALWDNADLIHVVSQEDVLDLPEYLFEVVDVRLGGRQLRAYQDMASDFVAELGGEEVVAQNEISRLGRLQQIASWWDGESAKHDALLDLLPAYEPPYLIWTHWREGAEALARRLQAAHVAVQHVAGGMTPAARDAVLEAFRAGDIQALVLSIGVGKFGHTFTGARTVIYVDKTWNADDYFQSLHRVRRIGLTHCPVVVTLRAPGTVDELVEDNLEGKLGGISRLTRSSLRELLMGLGRD